MRKLLMFLFVVYGISANATLFVPPVIVADTSRRPPETAERYRDRARKLFTVGGILAGTGAILGTTGALVVNNAHKNNDDVNEIGQVIGGIILFIFGVAAFTTGCILIGLGGASKAKANRLSLSFKPEKLTRLNGMAYRQTYMPAFGLHIRL